MKEGESVPWRNLKAVNSMIQFMTDRLYYCLLQGLTELLEGDTCTESRRQAEANWLPSLCHSAGSAIYKTNNCSIIQTERRIHFYLVGKIKTKQKQKNLPFPKMIEETNHLETHITEYVMVPS